MVRSEWRVAKHRLQVLEFCTHSVFSIAMRSAINNTEQASSLIVGERLLKGLSCQRLSRLHPHSAGCSVHGFPQ